MKLEWLVIKWEWYGKKDQVLIVSYKWNLYYILYRIESYKTFFISRVFIVI